MRDRESHRGSNGLKVHGAEGKTLGFQLRPELVSPLELNPLRKICPVSATCPSGKTICHSAPVFHSVLICIPNQYSFIWFASVSANHKLSGFVRMKVT
jgi:hypothetical protein